MFVFLLFLEENWWWIALNYIFIVSNNIVTCDKLRPLYRITLNKVDFSSSMGFVPSFKSAFSCTGAPTRLTPRGGSLRVDSLNRPRIWCRMNQIWLQHWFIFKRSNSHLPVYDRVVLWLTGLPVFAVQVDVLIDGLFVDLPAKAKQYYPLSIASYKVHRNTIRLALACQGSRLGVKLYN